MYCSLDDLKKQVQEDILLQLTDDDQSGQIDTVVIDEAVIYSETLINGYLRGRYTIPIVNYGFDSQPPDILKILAVDLTIFRLYSRRFHTDIPDGISEKYKNSIKILEQIQKGIISLGIETAGTPPELGEYRTNKSFDDRAFSKELLKDY